MDSDWIFYLTILAGASTIAFLVWLLLPSPFYRAAKRWERGQDSREYRHWIRYHTLKRSLSPLNIAMNAIQAPSFTEQDLKKLNELFAKLDQPPAEWIQAEVGSRFDPAIMKNADIDFQSNRKSLYVLTLHSVGVAWRGEVLKKASVTKCTSDRLTMHNIAFTDTAGKGVAETLLNFIEQNGELPPDFELSASKVKGFIDTRISESQAAGLLSTLLECHPESDFELIRPRSDQWFDDDTMVASGDQPGHRCKVVEVIYPGLKRKSDRTWRIKALVTIRNMNRNET